MLKVASFTFASYRVHESRSLVCFTFRVEFQNGTVRTYTDKLRFQNIRPEDWQNIPKEVLEPTLRALLLVLGINYWSVFPTRNIQIDGFALTREEARFWDALYLNGLGEFFYDMQMDFQNLIAFPYEDSAFAKPPSLFERPKRTLLLNGAGKDSILSAEMLLASGEQFDFFAFAPTPAHVRVAKLVGAKNISVTRHRDRRVGFIRSWYGISGAYPSVSTFTFIATLLAELRGYNSIVFSNERSADFGNLTYRGLSINHQWCKSSEAEKMINEYIQRYITPSISTSSWLRAYSELEIVRRFVQYPKYLSQVTSCNSYFWLPRISQHMSRKAYWCRQCPKCVFLFACFAAYLPKKDVVGMFGADLYANKRLLPLIRQILGVEGFKPLDCVGEPEEMILAMHMADMRNEFSREPALRLFNQYFPKEYAFEPLKKKVFAHS